MTAQQQRGVTYRQPPTVNPPLEAPTYGRAAGTDEPEWLWESLRYRFWDAAQFARGIAGAGLFRPDQRAGLAHWWSMLAALEGLGPPAYALMFARATEQHRSERVRWSLLAMLRDELQHEQVCRIAEQRLTGGGSRQEARTDHARDADRHQREVQREAERCWEEWRRALNRHGTAVMGGALLLRSLTIGRLYEEWAVGCAIPVVAATLQHVTRDAQRHQCVLRAMTDRESRSLSPAQRAEAAGQVQAIARLLSAALLDPIVEPQVAPDDPAGRHTCEPGLGVPTAEQRLELLRAALLQVRDLHGRHGIPFRAMPELAISAQPRGQRAEGPP